MPPIYTREELATLLETKKSILVVGPPFTGKTRSLWTLVAVLKKRNLGPLHLVDIDEKCDSLYEALTTEPDAVREKLIDYLVVHRIRTKGKINLTAQKVVQDKDTFNLLARELNEFENHVDPQTGLWKSGFECGAVIVDSLSKFNEIAEEFIAATLGHDFGSQGTDARNDYTMLMSKVKQTIYGLKSLPCMSGWIAHEMLVQSGVDGKITLLPSVAGKNTLAPSLAKNFNCVLYSTTKKLKDREGVQYMWQVQPEGPVKSAGITGKTGFPLFIEQDYRKIL